MRSSPFSGAAVVRTFAGTVWGVLAVLTGVVGVVVTWEVAGPFAVATTSVTASLFALALAWSMLQGSLTRSSAVLAGVGVPLVLLALMGWCQAIGAYGLLPPAIMAITSPQVIGFAAHAKRTAALRRQVRLEKWQRVVMDREIVDRRFEEIVRQFHSSGEAQET